MFIVNGNRENYETISGHQTIELISYKIVLLYVGSVDLNTVSPRVTQLLDLIMTQFSLVV